MSGLVSIASHPYENKVAMFSKRSAYLIDVPSLRFTSSNFSHGAPNPSNSGLWTLEGVSIGGADGIMHSKEGESAIPPTTGVYACGEYRLADASQSVDRFYAKWKTTPSQTASTRPRCPTI